MHRVSANRCAALGVESGRFGQQRVATAPVSHVPGLEDLGLLLLLGELLLELLHLRLLLADLLLQVRGLRVQLPLGLLQLLTALLLLLQPLCTEERREERSEERGEEERREGNM